ncbi:hypothetical protein [Flavihumibacter fluvii]|uniref:hypothetical protein n=1 Tax=Flavihumibacter fluvii TaxID=2838157 RepID=UPI001BDE102D|nr:hypothetical protein [Flavihumibacter fluvii]ULQ52869.1 hypothetical protein KJS93_00880 [Flavihumibacter fluvii]
MLIKKMKPKPFLLLALMLSFFACSKSTSRHPGLPDGTYTGTFQRLHQENSQLAAVSIKFDFPNWTGYSNINRYPALGSGTFRYLNDALTFENAGVWTADFDWTLILKDAYIDQVKDDSLIFSKSYGNGWIDIYRLKKLPSNE